MSSQGISNAYQQDFINFFLLNSLIDKFFLTYISLDTLLHKAYKSMEQI